MSDITITPELNSKLLKDGTQRIQIRITQNKAHRRIATEYSVHERYWNSDKHEVRKNHPLAAVLNAAIQTKVNELVAEQSKAAVMKKSLSAAELVQKAKKEVVGDSFFAYADVYLKEIPNPSTQEKNTGVIEKLKRYVGGKELLFAEIDFKFIRDYHRYLVHKLENMPSTAFKNMSIIRGIYYDAIKTNAFDPARDPWLKFPMSRPKAQPRTKLVLEEVELIATKPLSGEEANARNIFVFMFYGRGMRIGDALRLRWSNIETDLSRFTYVTHKSKKQVDALITEPMRLVLERYRSEYTRPEDYVFPYFARNPRRLPDHKLAESWAVEINDALLRVAKACGIRKNITTHVARHSFAEITRQMTGNDVWAVSRALVHSSMSSTQAYFDGEENNSGGRTITNCAAKAEKEAFKKTIVISNSDFKSYANDPV